MFATKMDHKLPLYVSSVPDAISLNIVALNILLEVLHGYAFCPVVFILKSKVHLQVQSNCSGPWMAKNALALGSSESVYNTPLQLPHWPHLLKQPFSQKYHQNLLYLHLHVWHLDATQSHLNYSLSRWQRELRHPKDPHLEYCTCQGGPFLCQLTLWHHSAAWTYAYAYA